MPPPPSAHDHHTCARQYRPATTAEHPQQLHAPLPARYAGRPSTRCSPRLTAGDRVSTSRIPSCCRGRFNTAAQIARVRPAADQAPRYQQPRNKEPGKTPADVGDNDQHRDNHPDARQRGDRRREPPGRRPPPRAQGFPRGSAGPGPGGGKIGQQIPEFTPGPRSQGPPHPLVELPGREPARLEVRTQVRHDRITVRIRSLHLSRKIIPRRSAHRPPAFLTPTVTGFRMYLMSRTSVTGTTAGCHQPQMTSVMVLSDSVVAGQPALGGPRAGRPAAAPPPERLVKACTRRFRGNAFFRRELTAWPSRRGVRWRPRRSR